MVVPGPLAWSPLTTERQRRRRRWPIVLFLGWLDKDTEIVSRERILGRTPPKQYRQENLQLMDDSKQNATVAAFRRLGYDVPEQGKGTLVVEVVRGAPVDGRLKPGDV